MGKPVQASPPNLSGQPSVEFRKGDFDATIWNKGYDVVIEKAVSCPCQGIDGTPLSSCTNCHGTGFFYINPFQTRAIVTGINSSNTYKDWSVERIGTIALTIRNDNDDKESFSFYDRVTLVQLNKQAPQIYGTFTETKQVFSDGEGNLFCFLTYKPIDILDVWTFAGPSSRLVRALDSACSVSEQNGFVLLIEGTMPTNNVISIRYRHQLQFHIIDIPHEVRYSLLRDKDNGEEKTVTLPMNAVARRSHLIKVLIPNFDGTGVQDNSYP